ncbi:ATPase, V1/A1 complex, subunit E [Geopyxis carbonaria]|nr:ATPase, V1/A1 complex, subunit E [Geopyxis carbonaria]
MAHALTDDQVQGELQKMVAFIKQEAHEKSREIKIKADEDFAVEKSKLVRQETAAIDAQFERKFKQAELSQQIARSTVTNKTRLQVLAARQDLLENIFEKAREKLADVPKDEKRYSDILKKLVLEGLYALHESSIKIGARKKDIDLLNEAIVQASQEYKDNSGQEVKVTIDQDNSIPDESHGGVFIIGTGGKITINNTLEERLKIIEADSLPTVRESVFGQNPRRRFYD